MVALIVIHNCAVLGLFALENITMAEMFGCKTALPGWLFLKKLVVLSLPVWSYHGGYFLHHDGITVSDRHYDHGIFSDWFNLCAENARSERP